MESVIYKEWCLLYDFVNWCIISKLYHWKMFNPIVLIIVDITFQILFYYLIKSFCLFIGLKIKSCRKLVVYFKLYYKYYKES